MASSDQSWPLQLCILTRPQTGNPLCWWGQGTSRTKALFLKGNHGHFLHLTSTGTMVNRNLFYYVVMSFTSIMMSWRCCWPAMYIRQYISQCNLFIKYGIKCATGSSLDSHKTAAPCWWTTAFVRCTWRTPEPYLEKRPMRVPSIVVRTGVPVGVQLISLVRPINIESVGYLRTCQTSTDDPINFFMLSFGHFANVFHWFWTVYRLDFNFPQLDLHRWTVALVQRDLF